MHELHSNYTADKSITYTYFLVSRVGQIQILRRVTSSSICKTFQYLLFWHTLCVTANIVIQIAEISCTINNMKCHWHNENSFEYICSSISINRIHQLSLPHITQAMRKENITETLQMKRKKEETLNRDVPCHHLFLFAYFIDQNRAIHKNKKNIFFFYFC